MKIVEKDVIHAASPRRVALISTLGYCAAFVSLGLATSAIGPALPGLAENTRTGLGQIGILFTGSNLGYMIGSLGFGKLLDRARGHVLMGMVLVVISTVLAGIPLIVEIWLLTAVFFVLGLAQGGLEVSANLMVVWTHRQRSNTFLNGLHFFFGIGAFIAPVIVAQSLRLSGDLNWAFLALAIYPLPVALWVLRLPSPHSPHSQKEIEASKPPWLLVGLITFVFLFYVGAEIGFGGWIYTYATTMKLASPTAAASLTSMFWGMLMVGRLLGITTATRFRPAPILAVSLSGCVLGLGMIWAFPSSATMLWIGTIATGLFMASIFPTMLAFSESQMIMSGMLTRWFFVGSGLGGMILPWLLGILLERFGPGAVMPALLLDALMTFLTFLACLALVRKLPFHPR